MATPPVFPAGTTLARYTTESVVGRGGMSVVYAAYDRQLDRRVALKVMEPPAADDGCFRERFLRESRLAASLDHPNVIPIYDAGESGDRLYIAMRLVTGSDLRRLLRLEGALEPARALAIAGQAADALDAAHARGLLHRDVKPANILLAAADGAAPAHVYLSDFGLAVPGGGNGALERSGFHGTAEYVAPEQITGRAERRSDVYALACVLYECLAGTPPFGRGRLFETLWRHLNEDAPPLSEHRPDTPAAVDAVFAAALAKDPAERPPTCGDLVARVRAGFGLDRPGRRRRGRLVSAIAAAAVAIAASVALAVRSDAPTGDAASGTESGTIVTLAGTGERGATGDGGPAERARLVEPNDLAVDAAGNVYVAETGGRIRRIDRDGVITTVAARGDPDYSTGWYPDLAVDAAGRLYVLDRDQPELRRVERDATITTVAGTGEPGLLAAGRRTRSPDLCANPSGPAFDPAGNAYVVCPAANRIVRIDPDGGLVTVAGSGVPGYSGDGGPATDAALNRPVAIAIDRTGNLYIADFLNNRVRVVDPAGVITTFAGNGDRTFSGDGWRARGVAVWSPSDVAVDDDGDVYVVESATHRVRRVDRRGIISTVAGTGRPGYAGDGGPGARAELRAPTSVAVGDDGAVYIADSGNWRVRKVLP
jgi:sugar lactone lactonase YvrE/tRNA A-37 threonylcarbamoyl transferase component Bud32